MAAKGRKKRTENPETAKKITEACRLKKEGYSQEEISEILGVSRGSINRYLDDALEKGFISSEERSGKSRVDKSLGKKICEEFGLKEAIIVAHGDKDKVASYGDFDAMGKEAAVLVSNLLESKMQVCLSHGRSVFGLVKYIEPKLKNISVHPLMLIRGLDFDERKIPSWVNAVVFASKTWHKQKWDQFIAPDIRDIEKPQEILEYAEKMSGTPEAKKSLERIEESNMILMGAGSIYPDTTIMRIAKKLGVEEELKPRNVIGSLCHVPIDNEGNPVKELNIHKLAITIELEKLKELAADKERHIILIAGGGYKIEVIKTILKAKYCNILVTDSSTAESILE